MSVDDVRRALVRIAHEIIERNHGTEELVVVGLQTGGVPLAARLVELLREIDGTDVPFGTLDVAFYRDDIGLAARAARRRPPTCRATSPGASWCSSTTCSSPAGPCEPRSTRSRDLGRARAVQLAVMVDRGHRELPIRPDYVGKNLPTRRDEVVEVSEDGVLIGDLGPV